MPNCVFVATHAVGCASPNLPCKFLEYRQPCGNQGAHKLFKDDGVTLAWGGMLRRRERLSPPSLAGCLKAEY